MARNGSSRRSIGKVSVCKGIREVPLDMSRIPPECADSDASDRSVAADVLLRQKPDDEEDEPEDDDENNEEDDDDGHDDGYSE